MCRCSRDLGSGKTTLVRQVLATVELPAHYASADQPTLQDRGWLEAQWDIGRLRARSDEGGGLLVLDEAQKITAWSDVVKRLWDEDTASGLPLRVVLLGSSALLLQRGLSDSLAGRFEVIRVPHWSFPEMRDAFGFDHDRPLPRPARGRGTRRRPAEALGDADPATQFRPEARRPQHRPHLGAVRGPAEPGA